MDPEEIKDEKSLRAWLEPRPREDALAIATRSALRVFPLFATEMESDWARKGDLTALPILRSLLTSGVARTYPTPEVRDAATADAAAIYAAADAATATAAAAARAATFADAADAALWQQVREDAKLISAGEDPVARPLWSAGPPDLVAKPDNTTRAIWAKDLALWSFWLRWWEGVLSGNQLDWELQKDVALIPDAIWTQGPAAVAQEIARIEFDFAIARTNNAEDIEPNPETGLLRLVPGSALPDDIAAYARRRIAKAIALFDDPVSLQLYGSISADLAMLRETIEDAANLPVELFDACASANRRLIVRSSNGECPPIEKDAILSDYLSRLREVAADILANDDQARSVLERRKGTKGNTALIEAANAIHNAVAQIAPVTEGHLAKALPRDAAIATDPRADAEDRKAASYRLAGRLLRIGKWAFYAAAGSGAAIIGTKEVLEALPAIWASPLFQKGVEIVLKWLGLG